MNEQLIRDLIISPKSASVLDRFVEDDSNTFFWVDHREQDEEIIGYCETCLKTGKLSAEYDAAADTLVIVYAGKKTPVPLQHSTGDRHITVWTLSLAIAPEYEIRYVHASSDGDTGAFLPLAAVVWKKLEDEFGVAAVAAAYMKLAEKPNTFTDSIPRLQGKSWWKFWLS